MACEVCGAATDCIMFDLVVSARRDAEAETHVLCARHYRRWIQWHNYKRWLARMQAT